MPDSQKVTLGNIHMDLERPISWGLVTGFGPQQSVIQTDATEAASLLTPEFLGKATTLKIEDIGGKTREFKEVYILGEVPSSKPWQRAILISDRRWKWTRAHVLGRYNVRRRTGQKRLLRQELVPIEISEVADEFFFAPWSTNEGTRWKPAEALVDIFDKIKKTDNFTFVMPANFKNEQPINDLEIDDAGPQALARAFAQLPGATLYIDPDGKVIVIDTLDGSEGDVVDAAGPEIIGGGHIGDDDIDFSGIRPPEFHIYFTKEHEFRVDAVEGGSVSEDDRFMTNVLPSPDPVLTIADEEVNAGTIVAIPAAFNAWNADTAFPPLASNWSNTVVANAFFEAALFNQFVPWGGDIPQPIETGRVNAVKQNWRQTYQINRRWTDRFYQLRAVRAAILDVTTGTRAPAMVFSDYSVRVSGRNVVTQDDRQFLFANISGFADNLDDANVSPARVQMIDPEAGVIRINYLTDLYGTVVQYYPSRIENVPSADFSDPALTHAIDEELLDGTSTFLSSTHRVAVVMTAIPASPNNKAQLFKVVVTPQEVAGVVVVDAGKTNGPIWEVRVGPGTVTARFAWSDDQSVVIERSFGVGLASGQAGEEQAEGDREILQTLLVNDEDIREFARALAAKLWGKMVARRLGRKTVRFNPDLVPTGAIQKILHQIGVKGEATTEISIAEERVAVAENVFLPDAVRRTINREVVE